MSRAKMSMFLFGFLLVCPFVSADRPLSVKEDTTSLADEQLLLGKKLANECICEI